MRKLICFVLLLFWFDCAMYAKSATETIGDISSIALPIGACLTTLYLGDTKGGIELLRSYTTTMALTYLFKYTIKERRPNSQNRDSFPSGHTASAFSAATFVHKRYGWKYATIPYFFAIYTGYSRIYANRHYPRDVYAGAAIGILSSWYFTTSNESVKIEPIGESDYIGLRVSYSW